LLKPIIEFGRDETVTLVPNSGIQFLDFAFHREAFEGMGRAVTFVSDWEDPSGVTIYPVHPGPEDTRIYHPKGSDRPQEAEEDDIYAVKAVAALDRFAGYWLPFPFFRRSGSGFDEGPTTWARIKIVALDEPDPKGRTHRLVLAFDTLLAPRLKGQPYTAPEEVSDATTKVVFGFSSDADANIGFCSLPWVADWIREQYAHGLGREKGRPVAPDGFGNPGEHWAAYMALMEGIAAACAIPQVELVDTFSDLARATPKVGVNLVLDIGNSRTCGVLIEDGRAQQFADMDDLYRLELRDLSHVEAVHSEPFESRIEFATADFGPVHHAAQSQRTAREAFFWPSPVRVGPEAAQLAALTDGTEGASGLSSAKRYLWDVDPRPQPWTNNNARLPPGGEPQEIRGRIVSKMTEAGRLVSRKRGDMPGLMRRYSRSSMYMLMLCELLIHALMQINSVHTRRNRPDSAIPRRLSQIILTLPTATPLAEQKIIRERAEEAVTLVWEVMGLDAKDEAGEPILPKPRVHQDWDEASCTHLVYLYNEIRDKFSGTPREFFRMVAQAPRDAPGAERLTVASIDIGGGTTDLMILSHELREGTDTVLEPRQVFREGFRLAGDDVLKEVIEHHILPEVARWLGGQGVSSPERRLGHVFGGNQEGMGQRERTMRAQLVSQVLSRAAVGLMRIYDGSLPEPDGPLPLGALLPEGAVVAEPALAWFAEAAGIPRGGGERDGLLEAPVRFDPAALDRLIDGLAEPMVRDLCDLVRCHDCDVLLVSGRPSQFPAFRRLIQSSMPLPANRIVSMGDYKVGNWYPFRSDDFRIRDPKTTAVVGAMLSHICSQTTGGLTLLTDGLKMRSTARFIGAMDQHGLIPEDKVLLSNVDLDSGRGVDEFTLSFENPCFIGFRQLPVPRWQGTPLYSVRLKDSEKALAKYRLPFKVTFTRLDNHKEGEEERAKEDFVVEDVEDAGREPMGRGAVICQLQTMMVESQAEAGYWLDTGVLRMGAAG
jgi:hypothetical protein